MPYSLTDLQAIINGGGSVVWQGRTISALADLPTQAQIDTFNETASGGLLPYRNLSLLATGASIRSGPGLVYGWFLYNNNPTLTRYVKFYDKAAVPTVGTDTPVLTLPLPPGAAANVEFSRGLPFLLGIGIAATGLVADADTTAPSANDVVVNVFYR